LKPIDSLIHLAKLFFQKLFKIFIHLHPQWLFLT
jgi:hypothetical protein